MSTCHEPVRVGDPGASAWFSCGERRPCPEHDMPCDDCGQAVAYCECEAVSDDPWDNGGEESWEARRDERAGS